jgi:hypothetical protein
MALSEMTIPFGHRELAPSSHNSTSVAAEHHHAAKPFPPGPGTPQRLGKTFTPRENELEWTESSWRLCAGPSLPSGMNIFHDSCLGSAHIMATISSPLYLSGPSSRVLSTYVPQWPWPPRTIHFQVRPEVRPDPINAPPKTRAAIPACHPLLTQMMYINIRARLLSREICIPRRITRKK